MVFLPLLTADFAASDDYLFLSRALQGQRILPLVIGDGRPVHGWLYDVVTASSVRSVADFWVYRTWGLVFLWLTCSMLFVILRHSGWSVGVSLAISISYGTSIQQVEAASPTTAMMSIPLAGLLACLAFRCAEYVLRARATKRVLAALAGCAMTFAALSTYQVPVFIWVLLCAARWLARPRALREAAREVGSLVVMPAIAAAAYTLVFFVLKIGSGGAEMGQRAALTTRPLFKLAWFVAFPLRDALNLHWMPTRDPFIDRYAGVHADVGREALLFYLHQPATWVSLATGALMVIGLWFAFDGTRRARLGQLVLALLLLPASCLPNVVIASLWGPFRTQVVLVALVQLYLLVGARAAWRRLAPAHWPPFLPALLLAAWVALGLGSSRQVARDVLVEPLACEWATLVSDMKRLGAHADVVVVPASTDLAAVPVMRYELGRPASAAPWAPAAMVTVARAQLQLPAAAFIHVQAPGDAPRPGPVVYLGCRR